MKKEPKYPMKWYYALIYCLLFLFALGNIGNGVMLITGFQYNYLDEENKELVSTYFPNLVKIDRVFGVLIILLAVFAIVVRFRLAGYKENGPTLLYFYYGTTALINIIYLIVSTSYMRSAIRSVNQSAANSIGSNFWTIIGMLIGAAVVISLNKIYFDKRSKLFNK